MARPTGTANKPKRMLVARLREVYGKDFNPIMKMAENATNLQKVADLAVSRLSEVADKTSSSDEDDIKIVAAALRGVSTTANDAISAWDRIAVYVQPKLKQVELTGEGGGAIDTKYTVEFVNAEAPSK